MVTKEKALYQVKLILDYLPEEEYKLIPKEMIDYIEDNFEYDENFTIDPKVPLEKQNIDDKAFEFLEKIIESIKVPKSDSLSQVDTPKSDDIQQGIDSNQSNPSDIMSENSRLKQLVDKLKEENSKIPKVKDLISEYKDVIKQKDEQINSLKKKNQELYEYIQKIPKFIRKLFIPDFEKMISAEDKKD